jgi:hypothetical protein
LLGGLLGFDLLGDVGPGAAIAQELTPGVVNWFAADSQIADSTKSGIEGIFEVAETAPGFQVFQVRTQVRLRRILTHQIAPRASKEVTGIDADRFADPGGEISVTEFGSSLPDPIAADLGDIAEPLLRGGEPLLSLTPAHECTMLGGGDQACNGQER